MTVVTVPVVAAATEGVEGAQALPMLVVWGAMQMQPQEVVVTHLAKGQSVAAVGLVDL